MVFPTGEERLSVSTEETSRFMEVFILKSFKESLLLSGCNLKLRSWSSDFYDLCT